MNFPKFADGRDYSAAALLRGRYGFKGELRVIGDVLRDLLFYRQRVGFNAFAVRADKVEPLNRALALKKAWLTGLRREQAPSRKDLGESEFDTGHKLTKFNPLIDWWWEAEGKGGQQECGLHVKAVDISGLKSKVGATA